MKIDWIVIKDKIRINLLDVLGKGDPNYTDEEIKKGIDLFIKSVIYDLKINSLNGLSKIILPALQEAYIEKKGEMGSLRIIADSLEGYLKKISIISGKKTYEEAKNIQLMPLLKLLELNVELTNQRNKDYPFFIEPNKESFRNKREYLEQICNAYLIRNEVHNTPELSESNIYTHLRDLLTVYVLTAIKFSSYIEALPNQEIHTNISDNVLNGSENKMLYDFISYGNTTTELKTQVLNAYILHNLIDKEEEAIEEIRQNANKYFENEQNLRFYERIVERLIQQKKLEFIPENKLKVRLSSTERKRLISVRNDFKDSKDLFLMYFSDTLNKYGISSQFDTILEQLIDFFVHNFNVDVQEAYNKGADLINVESEIFQVLMQSIKGACNDNQTAENFFRDLLELCEKNDFIIRVSASKALGKLTNPESFQNYIRMQERVVYIDTQLVLYLLCCKYTKISKYDNLYYKIVEDLLNISATNPTIKLKFSKLYLSEVGYQLKLALLLIPFEDFAHSKYSTNVFYRFYDFLKTNDLLDEGDESFSNFLKNWLLVDEEDAHDPNFNQIISTNITNLLKDELNIDVVHLPHYELRDTAVSVLEKVIKDNLLTPKPRHVLVNDALMVCHLSNSEEHSSEPFFFNMGQVFQLL
jgi:hypothetical protein